MIITLKLSSHTLVVTAAQSSVKGLLMALMIAAFCCQGAVGLEQARTPHEYRLTKKLLKNYDTGVRPRYNSNDSVLVEVRLSLQQIYDLDEKRQILTISGWLTAEWKDEFLRWNPEEYGGMQSIIMSPRKIWSPKMAIGNSADVLFHDWRHFWITVRHNGECRWQPGGNFAFTCALDMNFYPFDEQQCTMELETWYYTSDKVNLSNSMGSFGLETFLQHGEWAVVATRVRRKDVVYDYYKNEAFPEVYFTICLARKYTFYFMYIFLPCIMLSFVLLMAFLLPAESGEKVSLGVSILVAFSVFLLIVADLVPDTSDAVPIIAICLMYFMMTTALSVMSSTLVLMLHYRCVDKAPPEWVRVFVFDTVAPILCLGSISQWSKRHRHCHHRQASRSSAPWRSGAPKENGTCRVEPNDPETNQRRKLSLMNRTLSLEFLPLEQDEEDSSNNAIEDNHNESQCRLTDIQFQADEWRKMSEVLDRLFFWFFLLLILIALGSLFAFVSVFKGEGQLDEIN